MNHHSSFFFYNSQNVYIIQTYLIGELKKKKNDGISIPWNTTQQYKEQILMHATTKINLQGNMLGEKSQSQSFQII